MNFFYNFFLSKFKKRNNKNEKEIIISILKRKINFLPISKIAGRLFLIYILVVLISGFILSIPGVVISKGRNIFDSNGKKIGNYNFSWNYLIGLFTAASAFSDTGLTIPCLAADYTFFGQLIVLILIQTGGFGVLTFKIMIFVFLGKKISIKDKMLVQGERGNSSFGETIELIKNSFWFLIIIEFFATILLFFNFYFSKVSININDKHIIENITYHNFGKSLWSGLFHSISAINNAGFDIVGNSSLIAYNEEYFLQFIFMFEFIIGGLGFPTFYDIKKKFLSWKKKEKVKFSLFTKINFITYLLVSIIGFFLIWIVEYVNINVKFQNNDGNIIFLESIIRESTNNWNAFMNIFFNTFSTRNAGFSTIDLNKLLPTSKIIMSAMMFIGSAPSSTAGGIRTTTLAVIIATIWSIIRNNYNVNFFKRKIPDETVKRAMAVVIISIILVFFVSYIISFQNPHFNYLNILFLVSSAFGTTGLNIFGFSEMYNLGTFSLLMIILLMFIGQLGVSSSLLISIKGTGEKEYSYVEENIQIG